MKAILILLGFCLAQANSEMETVAKDTFETLKKYVEADTTNPPGNESRIVKIAAEKFKKAGIPFDITEFAPGRQNIVARLKGTGPEKAILILAHIDVVGTSNQVWKHPPQKVTEEDGYLYGRGVQDDLGMAALATEMLIHLKKTGTPLRRDVIVALTGDEESNGTGIEYILKHRPETLQAAFALNEGGGIALNKENKPYYIGMQVAEKIYLDLELITKGTTGHSSVPLKDNAISRMGRALEKVGKYQRPARLMDAVRSYYAGRAKIENPPLSKAMDAVAKSKGKLPADAMKIIEENPTDAANFRTTCVATLVNGGSRVNALPSEVRANINCRLLPDETKEQIIEDLRKTINDPQVEIRIALDGGTSKPSPLDGEGPIAIKKIAEKFWPGIIMIPTVSRGATDSKFLRQVGIPAYGVNPIAQREEDSKRAHGVDERIQKASLKPGAEFLHALLLEVAGAK